MRASTILTTVLVLAAASCQSERSIRDLSANPALYQPTGYRAGYKQPRKVFIATLVDEREALPPLGDGVYPRTYTQDHFWARPLASMLEDVLRREVGGAELFTEIVDDEALADWVLEPSLAAFYGCVEERVVGRTVHGFAKLHVVVRGPKDAAGLRPVLRSRSFEAPTNAGSLPSDINVTEDVSSPLDLSAIDFSDVDASSGELTVTLTTSTGGNLSAAAGTGITLGGTPNALTLTGTLADLNAYFNNT
ncbi:MAG TPA: hypothetical protein PKE00_10190, partial [Planctomycetota bacterium]|nr:hypothetical protein [Planctomycetota bacterium]